MGAGRLIWGIPVKWYVKVTPIKGTEAPLEAEYLWGPFSTRRDAYAADRIFLDNEYLGMNLLSEVCYEDADGHLRVDVRVLPDSSMPITAPQKCSCGGDLLPAGKTLQDGSPVYNCQDCPRMWGFVRDRFRCVGVQE